MAEKTSQVSQAIASTNHGLTVAALGDLNQELSTLGLLSKYPTLSTKLNALSKLVQQQQQQHQQGEEEQEEKYDYFEKYVTDDILIAIMGFLSQYEIAILRCVCDDLNDLIALNRTDIYSLNCPWHVNAFPNDREQVLNAFQLNSKYANICSNCGFNNDSNSNRNRLNGTNKDGISHRITSIEGNYQLYSIEVNISWRDQGFGNRKGRLFLKLFDCKGNIKSTLVLLPTCGHGNRNDRCYYQRKERFDEIEDTSIQTRHELNNFDENGIHSIFKCNEKGDYYQFWRFVGDGGGHQLFIDRFQATLTFRSILEDEDDDDEDNNENDNHRMEVE